jgi:exosortase/archaeosortase family protein
MIGAMISRAIAFIAIFAVLQFAWQAGDGSALHALWINRGVAAPAARIADAMTPGLGIVASSNQIRATRGGINIVNGCDGMDTTFLLLAAFCVAPIRLRSRATGILVGLPLCYGLNLLRILALLYARQHDMELFDLLHGIVTPVCMVAAIAAFYYAWLWRRDDRAAV